MQASSRVCLITGGAGFIGINLIRKIRDEFDRIVVVDCLHPQVHANGLCPADFPDDAELIRHSVTDPKAWDSILGAVHPDVVIHLAAETGTGQSLTEASRHADVNVLGTTQMLDAFSRNGCIPSTIVLASSRAVYGEGAWQSDQGGQVFYPPQRSKDQLEQGQWDFQGAHSLPHDASSTDARPTSIYGATKLSQEQILACWAKAFGVNFAVLRFQNVYGPGQSLINPYTGIVNLFMRLAREGKSIPIYEDGLMRRDFVFIDDVVEAIFSVMRSDEPANDPIDIGSGVSSTVLDMAKLIARRYGAPEPHISGQFRHGDVRHAVASLRAASEKLGWSPQVSMIDGLERLCSWYDRTRDRVEGVGEGLGGDRQIG